MRLDEGKGGGHSHAILSAFKGEIIILVLKGPVDSMFQNYLHAMLAMILLCTGLVRPGGILIIVLIHLVEGLGCPSSLVVLER